MAQGFKYFMIPTGISLNEEVGAKYTRSWVKKLTNGTTLNLPDGTHAVIGVQVSPPTTGSITISIQAFDGTDVVEEIVLGVQQSGTDGKPFVLPIPITYRTEPGITIRVSLSASGNCVVYGFRCVP